MMMIPAQRHRKLVTDFAPERSRLREFEVVGITGRALANETRLRRDEGEMGLVVATNVRGVFVAIQASSPHLMEGGRIITIGSNTAVRTAFPGASAYSMTKGAVASLVRGIAIDLAPRGITVNKVQPGPTETDMTATHVEMLKPLVPLGRLGKPEEIAALVA
jgi:3-oxoacyl-[acyl-carrier protein] reductase